MTSFILKVTLTQMDCKLFKELHQDFSDAPMGKNPPANAGDTGRSLVQEGSTRHGATEPEHHNC